MARKATLTALSVLLLAVSTATAQAIKVRKESVHVDGSLFLTMPLRAGTYLVHLPGGDSPLVTARVEKYRHPDKVVPGNPEGEVSYLVLRFTGVEGTAEIDYGLAGPRKAVARAVLDFGLVHGGGLDTARVRDFIGMAGQPFTEEKKRIQIIRTD